LSVDLNLISFPASRVVLSRNKNKFEADLNKLRLVSSIGGSFKKKLVTKYCPDQSIE
jgi:hypothetical protein